MIFSSDTIAAVSTAVSESGIGIIRISGPQAMEIGDRVFKTPGGKTTLSEAPTHTIHYGYVYDGETVIDEVLVSVMRAPRTFTAEDTVEINCHGGVYGMKRVLETVLKSGARAAEPGEFTKRAFLNGRIDLSEAEAVMDVISAKNRYALQSSVSQLKGSVRNKISDLRSRVLTETARIESALDDPEHYSLDGYADTLHEMNEGWLEETEKLIRSFENGRIIREGINTVIIGKPNAGKSSLLNRLMGEERAIVTDIAGTTRDVITETVTIGELTLNISDTAGIRDTEDVVEKIGVDKAVKSVEDADLLLYVVDISTDLDENDDMVSSLIGSKKTIILANKSDLENVTTSAALRSRYPHVPLVAISALTGEGMDEFETLLRDMFYKGGIDFNDEITITSMRQKEHLMNAAQSLQMVQRSIEDGMPEDFFTIDLSSASEELGQITGENTSEDLVNEIFSKFCMGK